MSGKNKVDSFSVQSNFNKKRNYSGESLVKEPEEKKEGEVEEKKEVNNFNKNIKKKAFNQGLSIQSSSSSQPDFY